MPSTRAICRPSSAAGCDVCNRGQFRSVGVTSLEAITNQVTMPRLGNCSDSLPACGGVGRRMDLFQKQEWVLLLEGARLSTGLRRTHLTPEEERQAEKFVHQGEVSRAR